MNKISNSQNKGSPSDLSRRGFLTGGAITSVDSTKPLVAVIGSKCMALDGIACQICGDICDPRAIKFFWTSKKVPMPQIVEASCTGCGDCLPICPTSAISLKNIEVPDNA
jgi:ferredoxin-type protein NapF